MLITLIKYSLLNSDPHQLHDLTIYQLPMCIRHLNVNYTVTPIKIS